MRTITLRVVPALLWLVTVGFTPSFAATLTVVTVAESGAGSLRDAINASNSNPGPDTITFQIGAGGPQVIALTSPLPSLSDVVVIDGTTQPGFASTPIVTLDGPGVGFGNGLDIASAGITIRGLVIVDFGQAGILVRSSGATIVGNYIGIDVAGSVSHGNSDGILVAATADGTIIGGPAAADGNVISGNRSHGISMAGDAGVGASDDNVVRGNIVGLDGSGVFAVPNGTVGVSIQGGDGNWIGGSLPGEANVISGNQQSGIFLRPAFNGGATDHAAGNVILGNLIGTDAAGTSVVPNGNSGISTFGAKGTLIGGSGAGARNVIGGNGWYGVVVGNHCYVNTMTCVAAEDTVIAGNFIGTDRTGGQDLGNRFDGVYVVGARRTTIGGATSAAANLISGNGHSGIVIAGQTGHSSEQILTLDTVITANLIGTDVTGMVAIPNNAGIVVAESQNTVIGRPGAERNLISGNATDGVILAKGTLPGPSSGHTVRANLIGTAIDGTTALGNGGAAVVLESSTLIGLQSSIIGGTGAGDGNTIRFNAGGIRVSGGSGNQILGNSIDLNGFLGIDLAGEGFVTPNDPQDADAGPNGRQNYPELTSAQVATTTLVSGVLNSTPSRTFRIEYFNSPAADPSGFGEGRVYLGFIHVTTDGLGDAAIVSSLPAVPPGSIISATATDLTALNTSEFSNSVAVVALPSLNVGDVIVSEGDDGGSTAAFTVSLTMASPSNVTFEYATANGTATATSDYVATAGAGVIPAGSLSTTILVTIVGETVVEPNETFVLNITNITQAVGDDVQGEATIANDDLENVPMLSPWPLGLLAILVAAVGAVAVRH